MELKLISEYSNTPVNGTDRSTNELFGSSSTLQSAVRELFQNSIDHFYGDNKKPSDKKFIFKISIEKSDFTFFDKSEIKSKIESCIDLTKKKANNKKSVYEKDRDYIDLVKVKNNLNNLHYIKIEDNSGGLSGSSVLEGDKGTGKIVTKFNNQKDGNSSKGSFGLGKDTAFALSEFYYVTFINKFDGDFNYISKFSFPAYFEKNSTNKEVKKTGECYHGQVFHSDDDHEIPRADWAKIDKGHDHIKEFRTIEDDGLTTVIPVYNTEFATDFTNKVIKELVISYFQAFKDGKCEIQIENKVNNEEIVCVNNLTYKKLFNNIGKSINLEQLKSNYNENNLYYTVKSFINDDVLFETIKLDNLTLELRGRTKIIKKINAILNVYKNEDLDSYITSNAEKIPAHKNNNFFIVRDGMLLREHKFLGVRSNRLASLDKAYCGYITFHDSEDNYFNNLIKKLEDPSHDKIDLSKLAISPFDHTSLEPSKRNFNDLFNLIKKRLYEKFKTDEEDGNEINWSMDLGSGNGDDSSKPSYNRNFKILKESLTKLSHDSKLRKSFLKKMNLKNKNGVSIDDEDIYVIENPKKSKKNPKPVDTLSEVVDSEADMNVNITRPGPLTGQSHKTISLKEHTRSKVINNKGNKKKYLLDVGEYKINGNCKLFLKQDSIRNNNPLSFRLLTLKIGKQLILDEHDTKHVHHDKFGRIISYEVKIDKVIDNANNITIEVAEPENTLSLFNIEIKKIS